MKLLITLLNDRFQPNAQPTAPDAFERLFNTLENASVCKDSQAIELQDYQAVHSQIESALDKIDITNLLNPMMLNTGGMEVLATIKRDLAHKIEATLLAGQYCNGTML